MARLGRAGLTDDQKAELWQRWHNGEGYSDIGRAIGKHRVRRPDCDFDFKRRSRLKYFK